MVNKLPWYVGGIHQCICTDIKENGAGEQVYYPVQYNWVEKMVFIGREIIGVEYLNIEREVCIMHAVLSSIQLIFFFVA